MAFKRYTLTATSGNDSRSIYEPDRVNQWVYTWDGLAGTDSLGFDRLQQKEFKIYKTADGAVHVDSVSGASHMIYVTLTNVEKLYFYYGYQVVTLQSYFNNSPTGSVLINGTAKQGSVLTAEHTLVDPDTIATPINWQWKANGVAIAGATSLSFTPTQAEVGKTITVVASYTDGGGTAESVTSTATRAVENTNDAPTATAASFVIDEDTRKTGVLAGSDIDGDSLRFVEASKPSHGSLSIQLDGSFSYDPAPDFYGADTFSFTVSDGALASQAATISVTVTPLNDPPVNHLPAQKVVAPAGSASMIRGLSISDADGDSGEVAVTIGVTHGAVSVATPPGLSVSMNGTSEVGLRGPLYAINAVLAQDSGLVYQPQTGYSGPDTLSVTTTEIRPGVTSGLLSDKDDIAITVEAPSGPAADSVIITGKAGQGLLLHASVGALTPVAGRVPDSSELRFQWTSGGAVIARAHTADLILSAEEAGAMISVTVSFTDTRGGEHTLTAPAIGPVVAASLRGSVQYRDGGPPVANVSADLYSSDSGSGSQPIAHAVTDASGNWVEGGLDFNTLLLTLSRTATRADLSHVTAADVLASLELAFGRNPNPDPDGPGGLSRPAISVTQWMAADITGDGHTTLADSMAILQGVVDPSHVGSVGWRFAEIAQDPSNAGSYGAPAQRPVSIELGTTSIADSIALLLGDVDGSWRPA